MDARANREQQDDGQKPEEGPQLHDAAGKPLPVALKRNAVELQPVIDELEAQPLGHPRL